MNLIESIFRGGLGLRADTGGSPAPWDDYWYESRGNETGSGMRVSPETAKRLSVVIACATARGRALSILPCKVRQDLKGGGSKVVEHHPLYDVLAYQPNQFQTAAEWYMMLQGHVDLRGNAYCEKIPGPRGPVDQLIPMHPDRVRVEIISKTGRLRYKYTDPLLNGQQRTLMQDEVFHLRDWADGSYAVGQSRISMGADTIGVALARQDYMARFLRNDARTGMVITGPKFATKEDERDFIESVRDGNTAANRGRPMFMPPGMAVTQLGVKPVDAELLDSMKASDVQICNMMGVLPHTVGIDAGKSATFASTEQFNIMDAQRNIHPMVRMWEQCIQRDLVLSDRYYVKFSMAALLRGDNATRFAGYASAIAAGWMCPDDVRELEDMNPIPDGAGKVFWRSANLLPLKQLAPPATPSAKTPAPKDEDDDDNSDVTDDGAGGDSGDDANAAMQARLSILAMDAAARCVRKEVNAVRKMISVRAAVDEVTKFYAEHGRWCAATMSVGATGSLNIKIACDARANHLNMLLADEDDEFSAAAQVWIDQIAATEPAKLAALAVEGVL